MQVSANLLLDERRDVSFWPKADIRGDTLDVCF